MAGGPVGRGYSSGMWELHLEWNRALERKSNILTIRVALRKRYSHTVQETGAADAHGHDATRGLHAITLPEM